MKYLVALLLIISFCFRANGQLERPDVFMSQYEMTPSGGQPYDEFYWFNTNLASLTKTGVSFPVTGTYRFDLSAYKVAGSPSVTVLIDGASKGTIVYTSASIEIKSLFIASISSGTHTVAIQLNNFSSGTNHIRVGLLYFTQTSQTSPYVYPVIVPSPLPTFGTQVLTKNDFGSKTLRGFNLGGNGTNAVGQSANSMIAMRATGANIARCFVNVWRSTGGDTYVFGNSSTTSAEELAKLDSTVARGTRLGYYVVPALEPDPVGNAQWGSPARKASIANLWATLAQRYNGNPTVAAYDLWNEPRSNFNYAEVIKWQTQMIDTIRKYDANHVIAVECISNDMFAMMLPLGYTNIIYSPHGYSTLKITHEGVSQYLNESPVTETVRNQYPLTTSSANLTAPWGISQLSAQHDDVRIMSQRFHVPIFIGEFSAINWAPPSTTAGKWTSTEWCNDNITLLEAEGWSWVYHNWNRGGEFAGWDPEIPSSYYAPPVNNFTYTNAAPFTSSSKPSGWGGSTTRKDTAPTIVMLKGWFALNTTSCPTSGVTTAKTYYFSSVCGDDARTATQARNPSTPWRTIGKLTSYWPSLLAGDSVLFHAGETWQGGDISQLTISKSGTVAAPIVIGRYGTGANPVFRGDTTINVTTTYSPIANVWQSDTLPQLGTVINMCFINGVFQQLGRYPNVGTTNGGYLTYESHSGQTSITDAQGLATNWVGGFAVVRTEKFNRDGATITGQSGGTLTMATGLARPPNNGFGFFIQKHIRTLDVNGEWFWKRKMFIYQTGGTAPANVTIPKINVLLDGTGFSNITVWGIDFKYANVDAIRVNGGSGWVIKNCNIDYSAGYAINNDNCDGMKVQDCYINHSLSSAIQMDNVSNAAVRRDTIYNTGQVAGMNHWLDVIGNGIFTRGANDTIELNIWKNTAYAAIHANWPSTAVNGFIIRKNLVDTFCNVQNDGGGIYTYNGSNNLNNTNILIDSNIVLHGIGAGAGTSQPTQTDAEGIYLDNNSKGVFTRGNTVAYSQRGIYLHFTQNCIVRNNTTFANLYGLFARSRVADPIRTCQNKANKFIARTTATSGGVNQYTGWFESSDGTAISEIGQFFSSGGCDSNYYARPISDGAANSTSMRNQGTNVTLASWKTAYPCPTPCYDQHSNISLKTVTSINSFLFIINPQNSTRDTTLSGTWRDVANAAYSGTITLQPYQSLVLMPSAALITPVITWNNPAAITYPTPLSSTQLNATVSGGISGTFTYTPPSGTVLNAGTQTLSVLFTPTDGSTYSTATKTVTIVVNKASATMTYSNLTQTYTGLPLAPTITTNPAGLTVINTTYNGVGATPINAGVYSIVSALTNINYTAPNISGTFTISKATATMTASNLTQTYNGSPKPITVVTNPVGLSGVAVTYNGSSTAPTNAGTYTIVVTLTNTNYTATTINTTLTINKATPTVSWSNPAAITYPTALSGTQLNATASVAGSFVYSPPSGTILNAGTQTLTVDFTPTDATNYNVVNGTSVTIVVNKGTATMSLSNTTQTYDGTAKTVTVTTSPVGLNVVTVTYDGVLTAPTNAGSYSVIAILNNSNYIASPASGTLTINKATATLSLSGLTKTYNGSPQSVTVTSVPAGLTVITTTYNGSATVPTNAGSYTVVSSLSNSNYQATDATGTLIINKATPVITWNNPTAITYGTALSPTQLNATSTVAGSFAYTPVLGTVLNAGTQTLSVNFTPTDATNYNSVSNVTVTLVVNKAIATITLSNLAQVYDGTQKFAIATTNPVGLATITITYNGSGTAPTNVGTYAVVASLTNSNYTATNATGNLVISKADATITLSGLTATYDGTQHSVTATTEPAGLTTITITYNGSSTAPIAAGSYAIIASLSNANYQATNATGTLVISKATPVISWSNPSAITFGVALGGVQLNASTSVAGTFTYTPPSGTILNAGTQILSVDFVPTDAANYNSVIGTSVTIVVNKATATISLSNLAQFYDGNPKPVTVTTNPVGLGTIAVTYDGSATVPTAVGTYAVIATLTNDNYTATPASDNLVISSSSADVTITDNVQTYTGSPLNVTVTVVGGYPYDLTYDGSATAPTNAGSFEAIATINDGIHTGADTATFTINKATPVITWSNPADITYPTALSVTQLNASATIAGTFTYTPASGTVLNAGTQILSVDFVPTDAANYNNVTDKTVTLVVNKGAATLSLSNLNQIYDGTAKTVTVTSSPVGLTVIDITYDGSPTPPSAVGTYAVVASLTNSNYTATNATGNLVISTSSAGIVISDYDVTYDGTQKSVTVSTNPNGLTYTVTYNGSATAPTNAGSYTVIATLTDASYTGADTQTLVIHKAGPVITWADPAAITYPTALSATQLNATADVAGTFTYTPVSGTILNAGTRSLSVSFVPTDATNYNNASKIVTIVVNQATATISLSNLTQAYDGTAKSATATTSPAGLSVISITYDGSTTAPTNVGVYYVVATLTNSNYTATPATDSLHITSASANIEISNTLQTYTGGTLPVTVTTNPVGLTYTVTYDGSATVPTDAGTYQVIATLTGGLFTGADTATYIIDKATPVITWANPSAIAYGTALSATQLNATSSVAGTFVYSPLSGTVLNAGSQSLSTTFTPTDTDNYNEVNKIVTIVVNNATATLTLGTLVFTYNGTQKPVSVTSSPSGLATITVTYNGSTTPPTNAGSYNVVASLTNDNYTASNVTGTEVIAKANPSLTWTNPAPIKQGTALSSLQLNATSNIPGTFVYTPTFGEIPAAGTTRIQATFTPTDLTNYNIVSITVPLSVFGNPFLDYYIRHGRVKYEEIP